MFGLKNFLLNQIRYSFRLNHAKILVKWFFCFQSYKVLKKTGNYRNLLEITGKKMKNLKLTIAEAQEMLLMSQSSVYAWIDKGKLQAIESPSGKLIVISETEANQIRDLNLKSKRNKTSKASTIRNEEGEIYSNNFQENSEIY